MAVRIGALADSTLTVRTLGISRAVTAASHAYLDKHGVPRHPDELRAHQGLQYTHITSRQQWRFLDAAGRSLYAQPRVRIRANNGEALAAAAVAGLGITSGPTFILGDYIRRGELVPVLTDFPRPVVDIHAVFPPGRLLPRRVRALTEHLAACYGEAPPWDRGLD